MRRHRRVGLVAHTGPVAHCTAPRVLFQLRSLLCSHFSTLCTFGPALRTPVHCTAPRALCQLLSLRSSAHIWPSPARTVALRTPAQLCTLSVPLPPRSQDAARSLLDHKRFERIDGRLDGIDGRLNGIDGRLDGIDTCVKKILKELESVTKYLKSVDKYQKFAFLTYRWVKALAVSSSVTSLLLTGLIKILTSARVFQIDLISLVGAVFAICFGTTFTSFGDEKSADLGAI